MGISDGRSVPKAEPACAGRIPPSRASAAWALTPMVSLSMGVESKPTGQTHGEFSEFQKKVNQNARCMLQAGVNERVVRALRRSTLWPHLNPAFTKDWTDPSTLENATDQELIHLLSHKRSGIMIKGGSRRGLEEIRRFLEQKKLEKDSEEMGHA